MSKMSPLELIQSMPGYSPASTNVEIETWLATATVSITSDRRITRKDIIRDAFPGNPDAGQDILTRLGQSTRLAVITMLEYLKPGAEGLNINNPTIQGTLDWAATVDAANPAPLTAAQVTAMKALAASSVSVYKDAGYSMPFPVHEIAAFRGELS